MYENQRLNQIGPREKLIQFGPAALTDAEVLAIFLRTGTQNLPVLVLAQQLLSQYKTIRGLLNISKHDLCETKGIGEVKFVQLQAALELGKRYFAETLAGKDLLKNPQITKNYLKAKLCQYQQEVFAAIFLNNQNQVIAFEELFYGSINLTAVHPRVIIKQALFHNAAAVILAHNHPSGSAVPSEADVQTTALIKKALALVEINLLDHFIVGDSVTSLVEIGKFSGSGI